MEISPEPKDSKDNALESVREGLLRLLGTFMGEDGLAFLNLANAITAVKQAQSLWQAPFAIGLGALTLLCRPKTDSEGKLTGVLQLPQVVVLFLFSSQVLSKTEGMAVSDLVRSALEPLEARYISLSTEVSGFGLTDEDAHTLFHIRFALGVLLLLKGDEERATRILREMAATKTAQRGQTWSSEGLNHLDVGDTKALAAIVLQDFCARKQDYGQALYLVTEALASNARGLFSENLLAVAPSLLESFVEKCEGLNEFMEWVDLFDRAAGIIEICGEADTSGVSPSDCKVASPQFLAWKFGQLVARLAIKNSPYSRQLPSSDYGTVVDSILREGGYGSDWGNGTVVASLLCECGEHRNWQILRQRYVSMWGALSRYQWLSLCEAGTQTDLYWAMRIGFADQMLGTIEQTAAIQSQSGPLPIIRDIEMTKDIASTIALRQLKGQQDVIKMLESLQKMSERQTPSKQEVRQQLQQRLIPVWNELPAKVVDTLVKAENYYRTGVDTDDAKVWFNKAVEASLNLCFVEPMIAFMQSRRDETIAVCFPPPRGMEYKNSSALRQLPIWEWSNAFELLSIPANKSFSSLGAADLKHFVKEHFGELPLPSLLELSRSLLDFCQQRKDGAHYHPSRYEKELQELEQMRELVLGTKRPSVITQIFQLFCTKK